MDHEDPVERFVQWLAEAREREASDAEAMSVATTGPDGRPSLRMVLVRGVDQRGFVFYTNLGSRKAVELDANPYAALCLHWKACERQVRIEGRVERVSDAEADAYFASRERESQLGAWASVQSSALPSRALLEERMADFTARFAGSAVPRPAFWSGYRVVPERIEFWQKMPHRLHQRVCFTRAVDGGWERGELYP